MVATTRNRRQRQQASGRSIASRQRHPAPTSIPTFFRFQSCNPTANAASGDRHSGKRHRLQYITGTRRFETHQTARSSFTAPAQRNSDDSKAIPYRPHAEPLAARSTDANGNGVT